MKKLLVYSLAICLALLASCSKDSSSNGNNGGGGSQTTGKRISEIYYSYSEQDYISYDDGLTWALEYSSSSDNSLSEVWHWDNDNLLSIDYYNQNQVNGTDNLIYNNAGMVSKIVYFYEGEESESVEFSYNGTAISQIRYFYHGIMDAAYDVSYANNKPVRITCTYMSEDKTMSKHGKSFINNMFKTDEISSRDGNLPYIVLTWTGNNLTKWERFNSDNEFYCTFTYDNKNNPYYGGSSLTAYLFAWGSPEDISQNNVLSETYYENGELSTNYYTYNYFENYPMQVHEAYEYMYQYSDYWSKYIYEYTHYYSYLTD